MDPIARAGAPVPAGWFAGPLGVAAARVRSALGDRTSWLMGTVFIGGLLVRVWGIGFGLPYRYHIDEPGWIAFGGQLCSGNFDFPAWTAGPNLLHFAMCAGDVVVFAGGLLTGAWYSTEQFQDYYHADPTVIYLAGRLINVLFGVATLLVLYHLGKRLWNRRVGFAAMTLLAFSFMHVRDSHFVVSDVLVTLLVVSSLLACVLSVQLSDNRLLIVGSLLAGAATGVKLNLVFCVLPVAVAALQFNRANRSLPGLRSMVGLIGGFFAGYVLGYPNVLKAFIDFPTFVGDFTSELHAAETRAALWQIDPVSGWHFYVGALGKGLGIPLALLALVGLLFSLWRRTGNDLLLLSFAVPFAGFMASRSYYTAHYMMPVLPILVLLAGRAVNESIGLISLSGTAQGLLSGLVVAGVLIPSAVSIVRTNTLLGVQDTRTAAKQWIEQHIPDGSTFAISIYSAWEVPLSTLAQPQPDSARTYRLLLFGGLGGLSDAAFEQLRQAGVEYVLISSYVYDVPLRQDFRLERRQEFFSKLNAGSTLVHVETPYRASEPPEFDYDRVYGPWSDFDAFSRPGPEVLIYQLH